MLIHKGLVKVMREERQFQLREDKITGQRASQKWRHTDRLLLLKCKAREWTMSGKEERVGSLQVIDHLEAQADVWKHCG